MKKFLFTLIALAICLPALAQSMPTHVRVVPKAGSPVLVSFSAEPEITFLTDGIRLASATEEPATFEFDEIDHIDFVSQSEVGSVAEEGMVIAAYPDRVEISNIPEGAPLRIYSLGGQLVKSANPAGSTVIYKSDFARGVYVVTVGNNSFKLSF